MEYLYHILIPKNFAEKVNDCFKNISNCIDSPFKYKISTRINGDHSYTGAYGLSEDDIKIFRVMFELNEDGIYWWKVDKNTGILDECNDADCLCYVGDKYSMKFLLRRSGFYLIGENDGESWSSKKTE